ncbi:hypothetical protein DNTS_014111 [Danionella cerebrum]|uniref:Neuropilin-2 n=1 Tax=Danionella cerebrum TaxID=2873325 RepID=A0A553NKR9_9TELE|nr:hypothetical protein DNTS_014111 [Danionella translucida]
MDVTLSFLTFDLENDPLQGSEGECKYDWLEVWDGLPQDFHCSNALGMETGKISDDQISASSSFYDGQWYPRQARLNFENNAWTPNEDSNKEYIQVLTGIATQGAVSKETHKSYFVTTFKLEVSTNGEDWMIYRHGKNHKVFHANADPSEVVLNRIPQPVLARFVRIRPQSWKNGIALRFELYGCQITDAPCSEMQGMLSGLLPDSQISASSMRDIHGVTGAARLVASRSGWFPSPTQPVAGEEWLQVDLAVPKTVRGIITQGARGVDGSTSAENRAFVRKYKLSHSLNGKDWSYIIDPKTNLPKARVIEGNTHYDTPEIRRFDEIVAQYIRIYPERWSPAGIGMRLEILGCDLPGKSLLNQEMKDVLCDRLSLVSFISAAPESFSCHCVTISRKDTSWVPLELNGALKKRKAEGQKENVGGGQGKPQGSVPRFISMAGVQESVSRHEGKFGLPRESTTIPDTATPTVPPQETSTGHRTPDSRLRVAHATLSSLGGLCDFEQSMCGWTHDPMSDLKWSLYSSSSPSLDLTLGPDNFGNFLYVEASPMSVQQRARLLSPSMGPERHPVCLLFYYQLQGQGQDSLRVLLRDEDQEETLLWVLKGDQGPMWREGRTILPQSPKPYQVVFEGFFERNSRGHIWVDNIHMSSSIELEHCTQPFAPFPPEITGIWSMDCIPACICNPHLMLCHMAPGSMLSTIIWGASPGWSNPTVDTTVSLQPMPTYWYYVIAGGGALFLLGCVMLVMVLCCHRYRLSAKKSQHSVSYQSTYTGQYASNGTGAPTGPGVEPMLTIRQENSEALLPNSEESLQAAMGARRQNEKRKARKRSLA